MPSSNIVNSFHYFIIMRLLFQIFNIPFVNYLLNLYPILLINYCNYCLKNLYIDYIRKKKCLKILNQKIFFKRIPIERYIIYTVHLVNNTKIYHAWP